MASPGTALARFGLGGRPGDRARIGRDPVGWLRAQIGAGEVPRPLAKLAASSETIRAVVPRMRPETEEGREALMDEVRSRFLSEMAARNEVAATTDLPFRERWVRFWSNHFCVSTTRREVLALAGAYEREAIRPHAFDRFEALLLAVVRHPAMLVYLDNLRSIGPSSPAGRRVGRGLNENLAREILELHTLGVDGGYGQADVEALARLLTGWTVDPADGRFRYEPARHEPGAVTLLGRSYASAGEQDAVAALRDLARHPSTARHVATKLVRHFVADEPPADAIARIATVFTEADGDLARVAAAIVELPAAWEAPPKLRSPQEVVIATARALGYADGMRMLESMRYLGQPPFGAPSPQGWPDVAREWLGPEAVLTRVEWAETVARQSVDRVDDVPALASEVIGPPLSDRTRRAIADRDRERALALLLASPEFQRR